MGGGRTASGARDAGRERRWEMSENGVVDEVEEFLRERSRELTTPRAGRLAREAAAMRGRASRVAASGSACGDGDGRAPGEGADEAGGGAAQRYRRVILR